MSSGQAIITFGKYAGQAIASVPDSYLNWLLEQSWFEKKYGEEGGLLEAIEEELRWRESTGEHLRDEE